jgi:PBP1b-binding outer membrane lipoprotein LpoB
MKRLQLAFALALFVAGCAHGKMGTVDQELQQGSFDKTAPIWVESINAKDTKFSGDKSADAKKTEATRTKIEQVYNQKIVDELVKKGYNAKVASGMMKKGIVLSGNVSKIENGSAAARYFVGMGAGSANMYTTFMLQDRGNNKTLSKFEIIGTSGGESGLGSYLDKHLEDGAKKTAEYIDHSLFPTKKK